MDGQADRLRGTLLGLAVGDALGAAVEFKPPGTFPPVTDYRAGGPHNLEKGQWTDDTSMALALADSIAHTGWDLNDQARRYIAWRDRGEFSVNGWCFDIGMTVSMGLSRFRELGEARLSGSRDEQASGNGSIMRLAPVPIGYCRLFPRDIDELLRLAEESSLPTHGSEQCLSACRYLALVLCGLIHGLPREEVLSPDWEPLKAAQANKPLHPRIAEVAEGSFLRKQPPEIRGSGYVVHSLEAALWAFHDAEDFAEAVLRAVNLGDDADTTGAVCGQLAGAYWGESGIPENWRNELDRRDLIERALEGLLAPAETTRFNIRLLDEIDDADAGGNGEAWGALFRLEQELDGFCRERNYGVSFEVGEARVRTRLHPDIRLLLDDLPERLADLSTGKELSLSLEECGYEVKFTPEQGKHLLCTVTSLEGQELPHGLHIDAGEAIAIFKKFLDQLVRRAVDEGYLSEERGSRMLGPLKLV